MFVTAMIDNPEILDQLKKKRADLLAEVKKVELAIEAFEPKNLSEIDRIANNETLGIYDFVTCKNYSEKVKFALDKLGKADVNDLYKYLIILGERSDSGLKKIILNTASTLYKNKEIERSKDNNRNLFISTKFIKKIDNQSCHKPIDSLLNKKIKNSKSR